MAHHPYQKVVERDFQCVVGADPSDDAVKPRAIQVSQAVIPDEERFWSAFVSAKRLADIPDPLRIRGHFTLAAIGHGCARLVTDAGGMVPVFYARAGSGFVVGTRLNEVARAVGAPVDITSVYDFLCNGAVCHPYTWFDGVRVCDPASFILFEGAQVTQEPYWHPAYNSSLSIEEAGAKLRGALEEAITDSAIRKTVALLYSGGEDSRVVAALTEAERLGFIILPVKNREFVLAKLSARLLGFVHVATSDAMIACFEAKYHFSFWRPFHAIRRADTDGNRATTLDPTWTSFLVVNHPEYPSGHSCFTGAMTKALEIYFGTNAIEFD